MYRLASALIAIVISANAIAESKVYKHDKLPVPLFYKFLAEEKATILAETGYSHDGMASMVTTFKLNGNTGGTITTVSDGVSTTYMLSEKKVFHCVQHISPQPLGNWCHALD